MTKALCAMLLALLVSVTQAQLSSHSAGPPPLVAGATSAPDRDDSIRPWLDVDEAPVEVHTAGMVAAPRNVAEINAADVGIVNAAQPGRPGTEDGPDSVRTMWDDSFPIDVGALLASMLATRAHGLDRALTDDGLDADGGMLSSTFPVAVPGAVEGRPGGRGSEPGGGFGGGGGAGSRALSGAGPVVIVPAPASLALMLAAVAVAGLGRRR
jgi:hypothetical protein